jgi:protein gp37
MGKDSKIEWTDHTFNPWRGCTKVSPGCDNCYAAALDHRWKPGGARHWGPGVLRLPASPKMWAEPNKWNDAAVKAGKSARVFAASQADVFDNEVPDLWRHSFAQTIYINPALDWILVTKRIGNASRMLRDSFKYVVGNGTPPNNMIVLATICNQEEWDRDRAKLFRLKERLGLKVGVSYEPALGPCNWEDIEHIDWLICGGESDQSLRLRPTMPFDLSWACEASIATELARVPFFMKQLGSKPVWRGEPVPKTDAHGRNLEDMPPSLRVREFWQPRRDTTPDPNIPF